MAEVKESFFYTKDHEWVNVTDNGIRMGITDYAQQSLGDITYIELPVVDEAYKATDTIANIESVKAASDIYAPVSGLVCACNDALEEEPELINTDPFDKGWICEFDVQSDVDTSGMMNSTEYSDYIKSL